MVFRSSLEQTGSMDSWGDYLPNNLARQTAASPTDKTCWLNQFTALKISGPDAERFLQGQLTCNLNDINTETVHYGACCNAKGRIVANFNISFDGENYWLVLPIESAEILEKHLQKYKVFFKATIENCQQDQLIFGQWLDGVKDSASHSDSHCLNISEHRRLIICANESAAEFTNLVPTLDWRLADISEGIHYITAEQTEQWLPQHINWHQIGGISFNKGCYTGQEIIARLQYLGKAKKALYHYSSNNSDISASQIGKQLFNTEGKNQGDLLFTRTLPSDDKVQIEVLAVLNTDDPDEIVYLTDSGDFPLTLQNLSYTEEKTV